MTVPRDRAWFSQHLPTMMSFVNKMNDDTERQKVSPPVKRTKRERPYMILDA